jgi:RNA polymerase sigma-54 factor
MALAQRLEFRQSQALVMTPQLMQAIKLLQLSSLDLVAYVDAELERNPLLERADGNDGPAAAESEPEAAADADPTPSDWSREELEVSRTAMEQGLGTELENVFPDERPAVQAPAERPSASEWAGVGAGGSETGADLEAYVSAETTLAGHLAGQAALAIADPMRGMIARYLIDLVDEAGYLTGGLDEVAEKLGAPPAEVEAVLAVLQTFDPTGVCARSLAECLAIQLRERDRFDPAMQALVGHLELVAKRDFAQLRKVCGVDEEDLADMLRELRALNPKPGLAFGGGTVQPVVPDVIVRRGPDGGWHIELNGDTLPRVLVNQRYHAQVAARARSNDKDKAYVADCLQSATWLMRALDQRARTILKVASEIVRQQDGFFEHGVRHLRPLNLKAIADAVGMHESTVSRVTANKYVATPRGIFELKYFFTAAIASADGGEAHSAEAVRHRIKALIDGETAQGVLSDDTIVDRLRQVGIDIARRTVAKYREAMRIPSSVQRRRDKLAAV